MPARATLTMGVMRARRPRKRVALRCAMLQRSMCRIRRIGRWWSVANISPYSRRINFLASTKLFDSSMTMAPWSTIAIPMAVVKAAKVLAKTMQVTLDLATTLTRATMEKLRRAMHFAACCNTCAAATGSGSYNRFCGAWAPFAEWALCHKG